MKGRFLLLTKEMDLDEVPPSMRDLIEGGAAIPTGSPEVQAVRIRDAQLSVGDWWSRQ